MKNIKWFITLIVAIFVLAACGSNTNSESTGESSGS